MYYVIRMTYLALVSHPQIMSTPPPPREWPVWSWPLTFWHGNGGQQIVPSWNVLIPLDSNIACLRCWRIGVWDRGFESCIQQTKTTCLLSIRIPLACARASKLTTTNMPYMKRISQTGMGPWSTHGKSFEQPMWPSHLTFWPENSDKMWNLSYRISSDKDPIITGDPLHSRALAHSRAPLFTQPCPHCSHSRAPGEQWARLCVFTLQGCVQAARLCRGSPVIIGTW